MKLRRPPPDLHAPRLSAVWLPGLQARVVADYAEGTITVQQPSRHGGTLTRPMAEYDDFDGDMADWIAHLREAAA